MARRGVFLCFFIGLTSLSRVAFGVEPGPAAPGAAAPSETAVASSADFLDAAVPVTPALRILGTEIVSQVTGSESPNDTTAKWDVDGTDLGHMFWHEEQLYMVFGDTFGPQGLIGRKNWRSNTMARIADPDPRNGFPIATMITGPDGAAKELIPSRKVDNDQMTVIPTYGVSVGGRMFLHYMSVKHWGQPGYWDVSYSGLAYSDDDGQNWQTPAAGLWPADSGFEQVAFVKDEAEGLLYTFGIPEGRQGGVRLRRVVPARILEAEAYNYWDGTAWVADPAAATVIVPGPVGEFSVAWSAAHGLWLMMYLEHDTHSVMLRTAPQMTGPWGDAQVVTTGEQFPRLYAPYMVPGSKIDSELYYTLSMWGPYNVFLMRTTLEPAGKAIAERSDVPATDAAGTPVASQN